MLEQIHWATNRRNKWKNLAVFAFDHREPFSALAAETGRDAKAITAFKNLAFRAVAEASSELEGQNDVQHCRGQHVRPVRPVREQPLPVLGGPFH
ncbi:MAG: DUF2090 domain-containing protein [Bilophila wadsworthia]|uniref:2-deoxy-5-keto-D-gluconate 6-phosphate aldolase domain-containing protein n=1 Tax=Bilophila wadsworthia TaxID=35833 RepID=UPI00300EE5C9